MSSKGARRRQRERERRREYAAVRQLQDLPTDDEHVACADAHLALTRALVDDATELLSELADHAAVSRDAWPIVPAADELRAVFEAVRGIAIESRTKLLAAHDRAARFLDGDHHLHVVGGRVVRMVVADAEAGPDDASDDIPF
jgi:hypothetical protein